MKMARLVWPRHFSSSAFMLDVVLGLIRMDSSD
jgi:hypothetical protein